MPLIVPYYRQTAGFSCGAASLVMTLHALKDTPVTRSFEFELWREGTMIGTSGMDQWGLTIPALRRGVPATIVAESDITFPTPSKHAKELFTEEQLEITQFAQRENRARAEEAGVRWERRAPTPDDARRALAEGKIPVLLVDLLILTKGEYPAPHWVVVAEMTDDLVVLNDPDPDGPGVRKMPIAEAWASTDVSLYNARPTLVVFG